MINETFGTSRYATRKKVKWFVENLGPISYRTGCFWLYKNDKPYFEIAWDAIGVQSFTNLIKAKNGMEKNREVKVVKIPDPAGEQLRRAYILPAGSKEFKESVFYHHEDLCNAVIIAFEKSKIDCRNWQRFGRNNAPCIITDDGKVYHSPDRYGFVDGKHCYFELELTRKEEKRTRRIFDWYRAALRQNVLNHPAFVFYITKDEKDRDWLANLAAQQRVPAGSVFFTTLPELLADPSIQTIYRPAYAA